MEELLQLLEYKIRQLIDERDQLKGSSKQLYLDESSRNREKELFLAKQQRAIVKIEALITKLRAIEKIL